MKHHDILFEALQQAHAWIVAREDAGRLHPFDQQLDQLRQQSIHPLRQGLNDEIVAIPIDDKRWKQIAFAVDETIRGCIDAELFAKRDRQLQPAAPELAIDRTVVLREDAERYLRSITVQSAREKAAVRADHAYNLARIGITCNVGAVDPEVSIPDPFFASWRDGDS
jgi:hypothetical protein